MTRSLLIALFSVVFVLSAGIARAQVTPPELRHGATAHYPTEALAQRLSAEVTIELTLDEHGRVIDSKLKTPAGHGFDEAALAAVREFEFEPARNSGSPIPATLDFTFEFRPPEAASAPEAPAKQPETRRDELEQSGPETLVTADRARLSASSSTVARSEFELRSAGSAAELLRVTPGLVVVQHSGGGKANQYFLRGFDADHGTDVALSFDGVPINLVSHAHGQGYADAGFVIPELVERIDIKKGPYFPELGDFATAGAIDLISSDRRDQSSLGFGYEVSPGHGQPSYRSLLIASPRLGSTEALFAADVARENGPFESPNRWDRYRLFDKLTFLAADGSELSASFASYAGDWRGSGQLPERAVARGLISRFGTLDPDEGGSSARHQLTLRYRVRSKAGSELDALAYHARYRLNLFSNFTFRLNDPERGDEIEQVDRRSLYGGKLRYRVPHELPGISAATSFGADVRNDDIHGELWNTSDRERWLARASHDVNTSAFGAFVAEQVSPASFLRFELGARADLLLFAVEDRLDPSAGTGTDSARQLSPKGSAAVDLLKGDDRSLSLFANYGYGFHSNDVRGAFASARVSPLARAVGADLGARGQLFRRWDFALSLFRLDLESETVWSGDEGSTEVAGATSRRGIELENRYRILDWLFADLDLTFTRARLRNEAESEGLALAPKQTWSGGVSARGDLGPGNARAALRFFGVGERPASDDGALIVPSFTQFDLALGYRLSRVDFGLDVENLFDSSFRSAAFATTGRLDGEPEPGSVVPAGFGCGRNARLAPAPDGGAPDGRFHGCEDLHFTPANPLTLRFSATFFVD